MHYEPSTGVTFVYQVISVTCWIKLKLGRNTPHYTTYMYPLLQILDFDFWLIAPSLMHWRCHSLCAVMSSNVGAWGMWACSLFLSFISYETSKYLNLKYLNIRLQDHNIGLYYSYNSVCDSPYIFSGHFLEQFRPCLPFFTCWNINR